MKIDPRIIDGCVYINALDQRDILVQNEGIGVILYSADYDFNSQAFTTRR